MSADARTTTIDPDLDDAIYRALLNAVGETLAFEATEVVVRVIAAHQDARRDMDARPYQRLSWMLGTGD